MGEPVDASASEHNGADGAVEQPGTPASAGGLDPERALRDLHERPLPEHAEVFEELHSELQRTLAEIDGG